MTITVVKRPIRLIFIVSLPMVVSVVPAGADDNTRRLEESRAVVAAFASRLQSKLRGAMQNGGPTAAITVCKDVAPQIALELSRETGATVSRTSLRYRNPSNAPEAWQTVVLQEFDQRAAATDQDGPLEHIEESSSGVRYMKAIRTGPLCLTCHGQSLSEPVSAALAEHYPQDMATGYEAGDIRGAFSIVWPSHEPL